MNIIIIINLEMDNVLKLLPRSKCVMKIRDVLSKNNKSGESGL